MSDDTSQGLEPEGDDEIIGKAFRLSIVFMAVLGAIAGAAYLLRPVDEVQEVVKDKDVGEIDDKVTDVDVLPEVRFTDVTAEAGIDFVHVSGAAGEKLLPETMGGGAAFFDADGDGDQDLLFINGRTWAHAPGEVVAPGNRLYLNDGAGAFTEAPGAMGLAGSGYGMGVAVGDVDGDGDQDVVTTGVGGNRLFLRGAAGFEDVTEGSGIAGAPEDWTTSAGFFDADGDGNLDLFVCHYVAWSRDLDLAQANTLDGEDRAYGPPTNFRGAFSSLYRGDGTGRFTDVSEAAGIRVASKVSGEAEGKALGVVFLDAEGDGDTDVFVANDTVKNHLFLNDGTGTFEEVSERSGFGFDRNGRATGAMGIDASDFRGDGTYGICIGNFANEMSSLYVSRRSRGAGRLTLRDDAIGEGIGSPSRSRLSFGLFFFDYDLDGRQDLLQVNGHLEESINRIQPSQHYLQPPQLFWNQGPDARSCFLEVPPATTGDLARDIAGRGSAYADIDGDGDQDVVIVQVGRPPLLLRNDQDLGRRSLRVELRQPGSKNLFALGATVVMTPDEGPAQRRFMTTTRSYLSQSELAVTFGLGEGAVPASLEITWPDGEVQRRAVTAEAVGETLVVERE